MGTIPSRLVGLMLSSCAVACGSGETSLRVGSGGQSSIGGMNAGDAPRAGKSSGSGGTRTAIGGTAPVMGGATSSGGLPSTSGGSSATGGAGPARGGTTNAGGTQDGNGGSATGGNSQGGTQSGGTSQSGGSGGGGALGGTRSGGASTQGGKPASGGEANAGAAGNGGTGTLPASGGHPSTGGSTAGGAGAGAPGTGGQGGQSVSDPKSVIRVQVNYDSTAKRYQFGFAVREQSGTPALVKRASKIDKLGSFVGVVVDPNTQAVLYQQTIGTGYYYRELTRAMSFRFPSRAAPFVFKMTAENADTGEQEEVVKTTIDPATVDQVEPSTVEVRSIKTALQSPKLLVPIYSEGYLQNRKDAFFQDAKNVADVLAARDFPGVARFEMVAVWAPSNKTLGTPGVAGVVPEQGTLLGLSFPVWSDITGPEMIIYPTDENRLRTALAQVPYDYPFVVVDDAQYWGVGNYNMYTAVPARSSSLELLVTHEMGHFFGLNEEYGNQLTELAFAPGMVEPWSQNITYQTQRGEIKWGDLIDAGLAIPTPASAWTTGQKIGAYRGGYANDSRTMIPVPDGVCQMSSGSEFCAVCRRAIDAKTAFDSE